MEPEQLLEQLKKALARRVNQLALSVTSGGVDNMETYKYIIGQINALEATKQELSNLLDDKEQKMKTQETSSISKEEVPKIKEGLLDKYEKEPVKEVTREETKLPKPTGWRMLVLPFRMKEKTDGGIIMGTETIDRQQVASQCGNVLAMGPDCYNDKNRFKDGPWCKVGDWVVFARYAGSRIEIEGGEVRLLNDDEELATVQDPTDILHKY